MNPTRISTTCDPIAARRRRSCASAALALSGLAAPALHAGSDLAIALAVDGGIPSTFEAPGDDLGDGVFNYQGSLFELEFFFSWNVFGSRGGDDVCNPALLNPGLTLVNTDAVSHTYSITFTHVAQPSTARNSVVAASIGGSATADDGGAAITSAVGGPIAVLKVDGAPALSAYTGFSLTLPSADSGLLPPGCSWDPYNLKPPVAAALASEFTFVLSPGDQVSFTGVLVASPAGSADLNDDCMVDGGDLGVLLAEFGTCGHSDLNYDGTVDSADLGIVLSWWGPLLPICPL